MIRGKHWSSGWIPWWIKASWAILGFHILKHLHTIWSLCQMVLNIGCICNNYLNNTQVLDGNVDFFPAIQWSNTLHERIKELIDVDKAIDELVIVDPQGLLDFFGFKHHRTKRVDCGSAFNRSAFTGLEEAIGIEHKVWDVEIDVEFCLGQEHQAVAAVWQVDGWALGW